MLAVWIVRVRTNTRIYHDHERSYKKNSNIFESKNEHSAYRSTDAVSNHKRVDPLPKFNVRTSSTLNIVKRTPT